ncbi:MAG: hypothetical protein KKA84_12990 [Bacteroidetes bacterium]|nr:hypothetical protein [Bacteroidota bacterium]
MSKIVLLENIEIGMKLAAPQINRYGQVLLSKGVEINGEHLKLYKTWGVERITVEENVDESTMSQAYLDRKAKIENRMKLRMLWEPSNIYEVDMYRSAVNSKTGQ